MFFKIFALKPTLAIITQLFLPSNLHSFLHDISFVKIFGSFTSVIISKTFRFKSSVLSRTHALLDMSSGVLQLPTLLHNLTANK